MTKPTHIHPVFDRLLQRSDKEALLGQRGGVFWFTGLSGSGKTTIAREVERALHNQGILVAVLDGDNVRTGLCNNLSFTAEDRTENIRRIAETAKLMVHNGTVVLGCFVSPTRDIRQMAADIVGPEDFHEIYVDTPLSVAESRDPKGLYQKARKGEIPNFTGISAPYEAPLNPSLSLPTEGRSVEECANEAVEFIVKAIQPSSETKK